MLKPLGAIAIRAGRRGLCKHSAYACAAQLFFPVPPLSRRGLPQFFHATPALLATLSLAPASAGLTASLLARLAPCVRPPTLNVSCVPSRCCASSSRSSRARIQRAARRRCRCELSSHRFYPRAVSPHAPSLRAHHLSALGFLAHVLSFLMRSPYLSTCAAFCVRSFSEPCTRLQSAPPHTCHASPRRHAHHLHCP
jgi:hypothetical protein